ALPCTSVYAPPPALTRTVVEAGATATVALPEVVPTVAVTVPAPVVEPAVNVVSWPLAGETEPGALVVQAAFGTEIGLPYWSAPAAVNNCVLPTVIVALAGETVIDASAAAVTVSVWVALAKPLAVADQYGNP